MNRAADDLISRTVLIDELMAGCMPLDLPGLSGVTGDELTIRDYIDSAPAVDATSVVHARWKQTDAYPHWLYCLNCYKRIVPNAEWIDEYNIPTNYCPNCGAKMDKEDNNG